MRSVSRRNRFRAAGLAGVAALALALSGCSSEPNVVAYVDGTKITERQLDESVAAVGQALTGSEISNQAVAVAMIHGIMAERIAANHQLVITDAERDALLKGSQLAPLLAVPAAKTVAYDLADQEFVAKKLGEQVYLEEIGKVDVELNPRYGVLNEAQKTIVNGESGSLAKPVPPATQP